MATPKGGKSGALDAFWDTVSGKSTPSSSMSDLFSSLPSSPSSKKAPQKKQQPSQDPILILIKALFSSSPNALTVVQIMKQTRREPTEVLDAIAKSVDAGFIEQHPRDTEPKSYRLTAAGIDYAQDAPA